jgi:uncharacterized protein
MQRQSLGIYFVAQMWGATFPVNRNEPESEAGRQAREQILSLAAEEPERFFLEALGGPAKSRTEKRDCACQPLPQRFMVRLTGRCNLACDYCFDSANCAPSDHLDQPTAERIADYILAVPVREPLISFLGGEPLANWTIGGFLVDTIRRKARALGKNPYFNIATNGTLITGTLAKDLVAPDITVQISIDGLRSGHDLHRRYPGGSGSYEAALNGLRRLCSVNSEARVDAQVVLTPGNTDLTAIAQELKASGFRRISFLYLTDEANGPTQWSEADVRHLMQERADFYRYFVESAIKGRPDVDLGFAAQVSSQPEGPAGLCSCGQREVYIDCRGNLYPCPKLYGKIEVAQIGNCATLDPDKPLPHRKPTVKDADCEQCWALAWCGGGCSFQCQKCTLLASGRTDQTQKLWCDLLRAQFARAAITHYFLLRFHPEALEGIRAIFADAG